MINPNKNLKKYVDKYGQELVDQIINEIRTNNWIRTGQLLKSVNHELVEVKEGVKLFIDINDYYQFLKAGKRKKTQPINSLSKTLKVRAQRLSSRTVSNSSIVKKNAEKERNFVGDILRKGLPIIDKQLTKQLETDVVKQIELQLKELDKI
jgi:hypothetical protein